MDKLEYIPGDLVMVKKSALQFAKDNEIKGTCATLHLYGNISTNSDMVTFEVGL